MLTKNDLKEIDKVVTKRIRKEVPAMIRKEVPVMIRKEVAPLKQDINSVKSDVAQIRKDMKVIITFFDREYLELRKRVDRIEEHLGLTAN